MSTYKPLKSAEPQSQQHHEREEERHRVLIGPLLVHDMATMREKSSNFFAPGCVKWRSVTLLQFTEFFGSILQLRALKDAEILGKYTRMKTLYD